MGLGKDRLDLLSQVGQSWEQGRGSGASSVTTQRPMVYGPGERIAYLLSSDLCSYLFMCFVSVAPCSARPGRLFAKYGLVMPFYNVSPFIVTLQSGKQEPVPDQRFISNALRRSNNRTSVICSGTRGYGGTGMLMS